MEVSWTRWSSTLNPLQEIYTDLNSSGLITHVKPLLCLYKYIYVSTFGPELFGFVFSPRMDPIQDIILR